MLAAMNSASEYRVMIFKVLACFVVIGVYSATGLV